MGVVSQTTVNGSSGMQPTPIVGCSLLILILVYFYPYACYDSNSMPTNQMKPPQSLQDTRSRKNSLVMLLFQSGVLWQRTPPYLAFLFMKNCQLLHYKSEAPVCI